MTTNVAFLFPGQGSQAVGMGADIFETSPAARAVFMRVDEALGFPLSQLCFAGPDEALRETINAQPAIVTVSLALLAALQETFSAHAPFLAFATLTPAFTAGHSVGEYAALVASGSLDLADAVRLVRERGRLMHDEGIRCPGSMTAIIAMNEGALQEVCQEATARTREHATGPHPGAGQVAIANYNAPGQIVISGEASALALAMELAKARGAKKIIPLAVSGAFHSPVMQPAATGLASVVAEITIHDALIPVIGNIQAVPLTNANAVREELNRQIVSPVQWVRSIEYMVAAGVTTFIEIGPGDALTGMVKRIAKSTMPRLLNVSSGADLAAVADTLKASGLVNI